MNLKSLVNNMKKKSWQLFWFKKYYALCVAIDYQKPTDRRLLVEEKKSQDMLIVLNKYQ